MVKKVRVKRSSELMSRLNKLEDLAEQLDLELVFTGPIILVDKRTNFEYDFVDLEAGDNNNIYSYISSFPSGMEYKLVRDVVSLEEEEETKK